LISASHRDAERYDAHGRQIEAVADVLRGLVLESAPNLDEGWSARSIAELVRSAALGNRLRRLDMSGRRALFSLFTAVSR